MPKIFEYFGIIFLFYANDHLPMHVHAQFQEHESKFEFELENGKLISVRTKKVKGKIPLPKQKMGDAEKFIQLYYKEIIQSWTDFFVLKKRVKSKKITKKIS